MKRIFFMLIISTVLACSKKEAAPDAHEHTAEAKEKYTCPMHPNVVQDGPGKCPVCGMDLVKQTASSTSSNDLMLTDTQMKLANVTVQTVKEQAIGQVVAINAQLKANEELTEVISTRAAGRIERLFFKETGKPIRQGEPLYELYSESLLTLQKEYLLAKSQFEKLKESRYEAILQSAEKKLLLYGLTKKQISELTSSQVPQPKITFVSPTSGIIKEISVAEGQYVSEGTLIYQIENTKQLWIEAEIYPSESKYVKRGDKIKVAVGGYEDEPLDATVHFVNPTMKANTQIIIVRATVANPDQKWKPGQAAQVFIQQASKKAISIPVDAVIRDGKGTHVYVQTDRNTFAPRRVTTGIENFSLVEVTDGLKAGELVAVSGAYLLYSEMILKKGVDPMAGHTH